MTSKSPDQTLLKAHYLNRWAAKNPDQLLYDIIEKLTERHNKIEEVSNIRLGSIHKQIVDMGSSIFKQKITR